MRAAIFIFFLFIIESTICHAIGVSPAEIEFKGDDILKQLIIFNTYGTNLELGIEPSIGYRTDNESIRLKAYDNAAISVYRDVETDGELKVIALGKGTILSGIVVPIRYSSKEYTIFDEKPKGRKIVYFAAGLPLAGVIFFLGRRFISFS